MSDEARWQEMSAWYKEIGTTSSGDMIVFLYDMNPGLKWVIAVVYEEDFHRLPEPLKTLVDEAVAAERIDERLQNPTKADAESWDKLELFDPPFTAMVGKGKKIDWSTVKVGATGEANDVGIPVGPYVWEPMTPGQAGLASKLAQDVATLSWMIADEVLEEFAEFVGEDSLPEDMYADMIPAVHRSASFEFSKLWPSVRGSLVRPAEDAFDGTLDALVVAVQEVEEGEFLATLVAHHPLLIDEDFAKVVLKTVGEKGIKKDVDGRVLQAKKAALYIELTSRHGLGKDVAVAIVEQVYEQIPF